MARRSAPQPQPRHRLVQQSGAHRRRNQRFSAKTMAPHQVTPGGFNLNECLHRGRRLDLRRIAVV
eukprot:6854017-Lingulodinium_polyedra.AAC.1